MGERSTIRTGVVLIEQVDVALREERRRRGSFVVRPVEILRVRPLDTTTPADCPAPRGDGVGPSTW